MLKAPIVAILLVVSMTAGLGATVDGDWHGVLDAGGVQLRVGLHIAGGSGGALSAKFDSYDQNAVGLTVDRVSFAGSHLSFEMTGLNAHYEGTLSADGSKIEGTFTQGGANLPLILERGSSTAVKHPQEPKPPFPYRSEDVSYENKPANVKLAGTLTIPDGAGPFPAVLLITGSGPQDRDETIFGHKPFLVIADHLTRAGIAVLRVDDRGVGKSTGNLSQSTLEDLTGDVLAGIGYLRSRKEINPKHIGLIGHSEGGLIAPLAVSRSSDVAFIVMLAGPAVKGEELLYAQAAAMDRAMGADEMAIATNREVQEKMFAIIEKNGANTAAAEKELHALVDGMKAGLSDSQKQALDRMMNVQIHQVLTPAFRYYLSYDPMPALRKVKCPVLALNGSHDRQVPPEQNLPAIAAALAAGGNSDYEIAELPGLNHLFQTSKTGALSEYSRIEETFSPQALDVMTSWILRHAGAAVAPRK